jgi:hypothetical protein
VSDEPLSKGTQPLAECPRCGGPVNVMQPAHPHTRVNGNQVEIDVLVTCPQGHDFPTEEAQRLLDAEDPGWAITTRAVPRSAYAERDDV